MKPAFFLDRDGVIVENRDNYIREWADVEIFPQALKALSLLHKADVPVFIVTNQSAVGRGILTITQADEINRRLLGEIEKAGGRVDGVYVCPHSPEANCLCRKPKPGLLLQASREHDIDLTKSIMVGDAFSDLKAGEAAGIRHLFLVKTGRGKAQHALHLETTIRDFTLCDTLLEIVETLLKSQ